MIDALRRTLRESIDTGDWETARLCWRILHNERVYRERFCEKPVERRGWEWL